MIKKILLVLIVCLILTGCASLKTSSYFGGGDKEDPTKGKTNGLAMEFEDGKPPNSAFVGHDVYVNLLVTNKGAHEVVDFNAEFVGVVKTESFVTSGEGVSGITLDPINSFGESNTEKIEVGSFSYNREIVGKIFEPLIKVDLCYDYGTDVVSDSFYVGKDSTYVAKGKVSSADNSNGPVQITKLEEELYGDKILFSFDVKHVGIGEIVDSCETDDGTDEEYEQDKVSVEILSPSGVECGSLGGGSSGEVYLVKNSAGVNCILDIDQDSEYQSLFEAKLEYYYKDTISKKITIKNADL